MDREEKLEIIKFGQKEGVSKACQVFGISRTLYYRWLQRYKAEGILGLGKKRGNVSPANKTSSGVEGQVLDLIFQYPEYGPQAIMYLMDDLGYKLSTSAVYNIMKRRGLNTKSKRIKMGKRKPNLVKRIEPIKRASISGSDWNIWITSFGSYDDLGTLYAYNILDKQSKIACSRLYTSCDVDNIMDLMTAVAAPIAQILNFDLHHVRFFYEDTVWDVPKRRLTEEIKKLFIGCVIEFVPMGVKIDDVQDEISHYTEKCIGIVLPRIQKKMPLQMLKLEFQRWVRHYNLHEHMQYELGCMSPLEYHMRVTGEKWVLPLWAYLDRAY